MNEIEFEKLKKLFEDGQRYVKDSSSFSSIYGNNYQYQLPLSSSSSSSSSFSNSIPIPIPTPPTQNINLEFESEFLKSIVLKEAGLEYSREALAKKALIAQYHNCSYSQCTFKSYDKGKKCQHNGVIFVSSGFVFVCRLSLNVHICGDKHCLSKILLPDGSGLVCQITGLMLAEEYSLAQSWNQVDVRIAGCDTAYVRPKYYLDDDDAEQDISLAYMVEHQNDFEPIDASDESVIGKSKRGRKRKDQQGNGDDDDDQDGYNDNMRRLLGRAEYERIKKKKSSRKLTFYDYLLKASRNNETDIRRVLQLYRKGTMTFYISKVEERSKRRETASITWEALSVSKPYLLNALKASKEATLQYEKHAHQYVKGCLKQGFHFDIFHILMLWNTYAAPAYKNIYYGLDIEKINNAYRAYFIEAMVRIWESLENLPIVKRNNIQFGLCANSILQRLSKGLKINLYYIPGDPKPRTKDSLRPEETNIAYSEEFTFIPPHHHLVLASTDQIRKRYTSASKQKVTTTSLVTGRRGAGCRTKPHPHRRQRVHSMMPPTKHLNSCYINAIEISPNKQELEKYAFRDF